LRTAEAKLTHTQLGHTCLEYTTADNPFSSSHSLELTGGQWGWSLVKARLTLQGHSRSRQ
jgi:hypothetical protein